MTQSAKKAGAAVGAAILMSAGTAAALPAFADAFEAPQAPSSQTQEEAAVFAIGEHAVSAEHLDGEFSFDQNVVSSNGDIANIFMRAAATMCASLPDYGATVLAQSIHVSAEGGASLDATVADLAQEDGAVETIAACACASNIQGGGAIVNAGVSGVTVESVAGLVGATAE